MNVNKHHLFDKELGYVKDENIRNIGIKTLDILPKYIFEVGASSTGRYHPSYSLGDGGLKRHMQGAMRIAIELFRCEACYNFGQYEKDCILIALCLHDGLKSGTQEDYEKSKYTKFEHPLLMAKFIMKNFKEGLYEDIKEDTVKLICKLISVHMGSFNTNQRSRIILPTPINEMEKFVHLVDYLASRKCLELNFETGLSY